MKRESVGGFVQIPLTLFTLAIALGGMGTWGLLRRWRHLAETQLRLDQCAAQATLEFKDTLDGVEADNIRITELRFAIISAVENPGVAAGARAALYLQVGIQDARLLKWNAKRGLWLARQTCGDSGDLPIPLPAMNWLRDPPDEFGPQKLEWEGPKPTEFQIEIGHPPRHAAARVYTADGLKGGILAKTNWKAEWTAPRGLFRAGLH